MPDLLTVQSLRAGFGSAEVLHGVGFEVAEGEIAVLLGANGVGKTTTLASIMGLVRPWSGRIAFDGEPIDRLDVERTVSRGLGMVPAPPGIFRELRVEENLRAAAPRRDADARITAVTTWFPILGARLEQRAGSLSGGEQRMLAIARALMRRPRLLLVDEASMGLAPAVVDTVLAVLDDVRRDGVTILMAEQNVAALDIADRAIVMERGRVVQTDTGAALERTRVRAASAYLGGTMAEAAR